MIDWGWATLALIGCVSSGLFGVSYPKHMWRRDRYCPTCERSER